jgi:hypothetical protein
MQVCRVSAMTNIRGNLVCHWLCCGHGHFDMASYDRYLSGEMQVRFCAKVPTQESLGLINVSQKTSMMQSVYQGRGC